MFGFPHHGAVWNTWPASHLGRVDAEFVGAHEEVVQGPGLVAGQRVQAHRAHAAQCVLNPTAVDVHQPVAARDGKGNQHRADTTLAVKASTSVYTK